MKGDRLDRAIDQVSARMVAVLDDDGMTLRIVSALPERTPGWRWLVPQFAAIGAIVLAVLVWTTGERSTPATLPSSNGARMDVLAIVVSANEPGTALGALPLKPQELQERQEPREPRARADLLPAPDHERALPALEAFSSLSVPGAQTRDIALPAAIGLATIEIAALKLTAESVTTEKEE